MGDRVVVGGDDPVRPTAVTVDSAFGISAMSAITDLVVINDRI